MRTDHAFSRTDFVLLRHGDGHVLTDSPCYFAQESGGPIEIVIREHATEQDLLYMHQRFGVPMAEMTAFRDHQAT